MEAACTYCYSIFNSRYRAVAEQLSVLDPLMRSPTSHRLVRQKAASYMRSHPEEFKYFLDDSVDFDTYCDKVENSNGAHLLLF